MPEKILVADESPTVRNVAESLLKKHGYTVLLADDGARALAVARTDKPDLIFLDDSMAVPDGEGTWSTVRQEGELKDVPVIMLLSGDKTDAEQRLKEIGAKGFISKPFNPREILDYAERLLCKETVPPAGDTPRKAKEPAPVGDHVSGKKEPGIDERKPEDGLNILETSDVMEDLGPSGTGSDEEPTHGFDWFLYELRKETQKKEGASSGVEEKQGPPGRGTSDEDVRLQKESNIYQIDEQEKGYEDFLTDLRDEVEQSYEEAATRSRPSAVREIGRSRLDQLVTHLKESIAEKVAQEVAKKLSPEFLEKIIREEIQKIEEE